MSLSWQRSLQCHQPSVGRLFLVVLGAGLWEAIAARLRHSRSLQGAALCLTGSPSDLMGFVRQNRPDCVVCHGLGHTRV
ncbi:hypothetical protein C8Q70DRAFT_999687 [Cubamyces menziesii]|nr:hypothetical protein C8Q70DRAFT_999687 [Cubamyces menziesii]